MNCFPFKLSRVPSAHPTNQTSPRTPSIPLTSNLRRTGRALDFSSLGPQPNNEKRCGPFTRHPGASCPFSPLPPPRRSNVAQKNEACLLNLDPEKFFVKRILTENTPPVYIVFEKKQTPAQIGLGNPNFEPSFRNPRVQFYIGEDDVTTPHLTRVSRV